MEKLIEAWLTYLIMNKGRAESTATKYRGFLQRLVAWAKDKDLRDLTRQDLEEFAGKVMHQAGLAPRSRRALVAAVRGFYEYLAREGIIKHSPAMGLDYPSAGRKMPTALSLQNAEKILMQCDLDTFKGVRDAAILGVLIGLGLRVSGLCGLNESSLLWVQDDKGGELLVFRILEKGKKERLVPAPGETRLLMRIYLGHPDLEGIDRALPNGDQVLFVSLRNRSIPADKYHGDARRIAPRSIHDLIRLHGERANIPPDQLHPHAFRHLYATELVESDIPDVIGQALTGHEDPKSYKIYNHMAMRKLQRVVKQANPMGKIKTPVSQILATLDNSR